MEETIRLRPLIESLAAPDGALYLLQGPAGGDCVIRDATPEVRAVVEALRSGGTVTGIAGDCSAAPEVVRGVVDALGSLDLLEPPDGRPLPAEEAERFDRQLLYLRQHASGHGGADLQRRLRAARVVVLGCGGLGSWAAWSLATIGVGALVLVDPDTVDPTNLNRQLM